MVRPNRQVIGYARVSTAWPNLDQQLELLGSIDRLFLEKQDSATGEQPVLKELLRFAQDGDRVVVASMDRLVRSAFDLNAVVQTLAAKGVIITFIKEELSFRQDGDAFAELQLKIIAAVAQLEQKSAYEKQAENTSARKKGGRPSGRRRALTPEQVAQAKADIDGGAPNAEVARKLGVHRTTLYRSLNRWRQN